MAKGNSAAKAHRRSEARRTRNQAVRSAAKTFIRKAERLIAAGKSDEAQHAAVRAIAQLDRAAQKKVIHRNNSARRKSRLVTKLNRLLASGSQASA